MTRHVSIHAPLFFVIAIFGGFAHCGVARGQEAARYAIVDIGDIGGRGTFPRAIGNGGEVVGNTLTTQNVIKAFVWQSGDHSFLEPLVPGLSADAYGINDAGEVVGKSYIALGVQHAVLWLADGTSIDLGTLGGEDSVATAINEARQVVGGSDLTDGGSHPFLWEDGKMIDLGDFGRPSGGANGINEFGQIVGVAGILPFSARAFLWDNGKMFNLDTLPNGSRSIANDINDAGIIVGVANASNGRDNAVIWENRVIRSIHGLGLETVAHGINASGQVVGFADIDGVFDHTTGFLYEPGGRMIDLMMLIPPRHRWRQLISAFDINDAGEIVTYGDRLGGGDREYRGVLLTPVVPTLTLQGPQPGTAGAVNGLRITGCTPGARVNFFYSTVGGGTLIPGCNHTEGVTLQLENPILAGSATANQNGVATLTRFVPNSARNLGDVLIQAVQPNGCKISQLVVHRFE